MKQQQADEWLSVDGRVQQVIIFRHSADLMSRCTEFHVLNLSLHERETVEKVYVNTGIRIFDRLHDGNKILDRLQTRVYLSSVTRFIQSL